MRVNKYARLLLVAALGPALQTHAGTGAAGLLGLPLFPVPIVREKIALTKALSEVGGHARRGYVSFGIEVRLKDSEEPTVDLNIQPPSTLGEALRQIFQQLPGYRFEMVSEHLIDVYPAGAKEDPNDVLNIPVSRFNVVKGYFL